MRTIQSTPVQNIIACPRCYAENPKGPHNFLTYDPNRPRVVICEKVHGEIPIAEGKKGPRFYLSHYEEP